MPNKFSISRRHFLVMPMFLTACNPFRSTSVLKITGVTMGTTYSVTAIDRSGSLSETDLKKWIESELSSVNGSMSNWDSSSEISEINRLKSTNAFKISDELSYVLQAAQNIHDQSDGQFDITLGPLIELWGFGTSKKNSDFPDKQQIDAALRIIGQGKLLKVSNGSLQKLRAETQINLSAIAKGYGVDRISSVVEALGVKDYLVEIGGDLYASGLNPAGEPWQIGIEVPDATNRTVHKVVTVSNFGMATSGDYRNYFQDKGKRYSHIIDAKTGYPITHTTASVTVLEKNAMLADAWATAMLVLGQSRGLEIANDRDLAVLFIERSSKDTYNKFITTESRRYTELNN